ncbi:unnamed protein product [Psylliodes chrysocephalus]|uniref:Replication protein A 14 kDa subunit n=1 Tax=Psylliodes chrysocephalus TaxID=3402493 RepID=A0A9P0DAL7_9CUCU|nr:unnamed protein product [Psylliodes chrysocephala]
MLREKVNGDQLPLFINKKVSLTGFVTQKAPNGLWFEIRTPDNQIVKISMKRPIDQPLEGYVEVEGTSTGNGVTADEYVIFDNEKFDAKGYTAMCQILNQVPKLWILE